MSIVVGNLYVPNFKRVALTLGVGLLILEVLILCDLGIVLKQNNISLISSWLYFSALRAQNSEKISYSRFWSFLQILWLVEILLYIPVLVLALNEIKRYSSSSNLSSTFWLNSSTEFLICSPEIKLFGKLYLNVFQYGPLSIS
uniref:DNA polymerase n=1 Tax=Daedaleopsis sinensis TaxID=596167 RepID=UPI002E78CCE6|nr:DNA polymerase [Daedaleopsis sinensis]WQT73196.1 DNA polymerase [Daedaleopsis sinensis]